MLERIKGKLIFFEKYWIGNLNNRLENILTIQSLKKYPKKNVIIGLLVYEYVQSSLTTAILKIFETLVLYEKLDKKYKREGNLEKVVFYRNKLIAHPEEEFLDSKRREEFLKNNTSTTDKIKIIRNAADDLIKMINAYLDKNNVQKELTCRIIFSPKIEREALITLYETIIEQDESAFK